jgi:hypothetical protein
MFNPLKTPTQIYIYKYITFYFNLQNSVADVTSFRPHRLLNTVNYGPSRSRVSYCKFYILSACFSAPLSPSVTFFNPHVRN